MFSVRIISCLLILVTAVASGIAAEKWYEGGTLSRATPKQWRSATPQNRLATSADFLAQMWLDKKLKPQMQQSIKSMEDLKPFSQKLMTALDDSTRDREEAPRIYESAAAIILLLGWAG